MESLRASSVQPGQVFAARYRIVRALKEGGMGVVYEVRHLETEAPLALKMMLPDKESSQALRERFCLEWKLTANIVGEHVVRAFDAGFDEETRRPFLVMELLEGEDLGTRLAREGPLPPAAALALLEQLARALGRIHAAGVVHRDIRPSNLFVTKRDDGSPLLKVLDFGIAKVVVETTRTVEPTLIVGSPPYMPPEQLDGDGDIGTAADLYAFAHVAFAALVGSAYWEDEHKREGMGLLRRKIKLGLPELASARAARRGVSLPLAFDAWFERATRVDAYDRPESPVELVAELGRVLGIAPPLAASARRGVLAKHLRRAAPIALAAAGAIVLTLTLARRHAVAVQATQAPVATPDRPPDIPPTRPPAPAASAPVESSASAAPPPNPRPAAPPAGGTGSPRGAPPNAPSRPSVASPAALPAHAPTAAAASATRSSPPDIWGGGVQ
jgi:serine/threonine protein kinase